MKTEKRRPKVTVVIPVHNGENCLKRIVKKLLKQTLEEIEIILVENGSKDNSWDLCKRLEKKTW